ncbi:Sugar ABC transporter substrate-binding protein OS=Streptomyces tendae OX=1932 GN=GUR47_31535 PE=4 SV=1 [Streptomyces tendae]
MRARTKIMTLFVCAVLLLAGCSDGGGGADDGRIILRFQSLAWQDESVKANKELVREWNATEPDVRVEYVQGSWDSVHDQLLTSFEGGEVPDIIHDASDDLAYFADGGHLADLTDRRRTAEVGHTPAQLGAAPPATASRCAVPPGAPGADRQRVPAREVRRPHPTPQHPGPGGVRQVTKELSGDGTYGVAWPLKEPVSATLNLSLLLRRQAVPPGCRRQGDRSLRGRRPGRAPHRPRPGRHRPQRLAHHPGQRRLHTLPGFFAGKYAMVPLGFSYRQQIEQQAPELPRRRRPVAATARRGVRGGRAGPGPAHDIASLPRPRYSAAAGGVPVISLSPCMVAGRY